MKLNIKLSLLAVFGSLCGIATAATSITPDMPSGEYDSIVNDSGALVTLENKTLTLTGTGDVFNQTVNNSATQIKGGSITVSNEGDVSVGKNADSKKNTKKTLVLTDGATVTGVGDFAVAVKEAGNVLAITNATISAETFSIDNGGCQGVNSVFAGPNAKISVTGEFATEDGPTGKSTAGAVFRMSGAGAEISADTANIGAVSNTSFAVEDGAKATFKTLNVGIGTVSGVQVDVLDATMDVTGGLSFGKDADSMGHTLVVSGESAALNHKTTSKVDIFGSGSDCHIIVKDGATFSFGGTRRIFQNVSESTLEFYNGGHLDSLNPINFGYGTKARDLDCTPNRIIVGQGGVIDAPNSGINIYSVNNELVVSNGWIHTAVTVGYAAGTEYNESTNVALVVQGRSPRVDLVSLKMAGASPRVRFELDREGYAWSGEFAERVAPVNITYKYGATLPDQAVLEADVRKLASERRGRPIPVITSEKAMTIPDAVLERANALGKAARHKYAFALSEDGKTLSVIPEYRGLAVILK